MIVITGAAGFIGSALAGYFNEHFPESDLVLVDKFSNQSKQGNYKNKKWISCVERQTFFGFLDENYMKISFIFHLGARSDTTETNVEIFNRLNLNYSKRLWKKCVDYQIPLVYASSAATYGDGGLGYKDDHALINDFKPLNLYGESKNDFDKWVLNSKAQPPFWAGLKFFNVYGPNEYHKGRMASVIFHAFNQIRVTKKMNLFRSYHADFEDGQQLRDFIYVKDVLDVCAFLYKGSATIDSGIYNVGTGEAHSFEDLTLAVFMAMGIDANIDYIDMPEDLREKYQYYTQADMTKLKAQGYKGAAYTLEEGVSEYVKHFLFEKAYL